jgi:hypothetical protein
MTAENVARLPFTTTTEAKTKISKSTPCKVENGPVRSALAARRPGQKKKKPNLMLCHTKTPAARSARAFA